MFPKTNQTAAFIALLSAFFAFFPNADAATETVSQRQDDYVYTCHRQQTVTFPSGYKVKAYSSRADNDGHIWNYELYDSANVLLET